MFKFTKEILEQAITYSDFMDYTKSILESDKKESPYDSDGYLSYTEANYKRSEKILRNFQLDKKLYNILSEDIKNWTWVLLTEPWCGDGSFIQPVLYAMSVAAAGEIDFKIYLRDKHPEIMNQFLTNGGMAIPKLVCLDTNLNVIGSWGPRPEVLQIKFSEWKKEGKVDVLEEKIKLTYRWYLKDKNESIQKEFILLMKNWKKEENDR